jgi:hypothetical protein
MFSESIYIKEDDTYFRVIAIFEEIYREVTKLEQAKHEELKRVGAKA